MKRHAFALATTAISLLSVCAFVACKSSDPPIEPISNDTADARADADSDSAPTKDASACPATPDPCSTGPLHGSVDVPSQDSPVSACACTPHCGATRVTLPNYPNQYLASALPSGSCASEGESCSMTALADFMECDSGLVGCSESEFECTCKSGEWSCVNAVPGASGCGCQ